MAENEAAGTFEKCMKALSNHFQKNAAMHEADAEDHRAHAACHEGLSSCMKTAGLVKGDREDFHSEIASRHKAAASRCDADAVRCRKVGEFCMKCSTMKASEGEMAKVVSAVSAAVIENVDKRFGSMVMETGVKKVFMTEDPSGGVLVPRSGGPSVPTDLSRIDPSFQDLFRE